MTRRGEAVLTISSLVAIGMSATAALMTWVLLTQPLTVASAVRDRDLMPVIQAMASAVADVVAVLLRFF